MEEENKKEKIAAVVVTYNRKELLKECLDALLAQTYPVDSIILIDNASTDGTPEFLKEQGYLKNSKIDYVRLPENTGGAGGFHEGVKRGYEKGYDWLWLMDDDGLPSENCLKQLLRYKNKANFISPLVIRIDKKDELSFGLEKNITTYKEAVDNSKDGILENMANPFNGTLISRRLIKKIGNIKKELFIWGDETEYYLRALNSNLGVATVIDAIHYHPKDRMQLIQLKYTPYKIIYQDNKLRNYCMIRNQTYIAKKYNILSFFKSFLEYLYFFIVCNKFDIKGFSFYMRAVIHGLFEHWGEEKRYFL